MKIKLDENLPALLAERLRTLGHDVETVPEEGLAGFHDDLVWQAAQHEGRFLITQDLDFSDIRTFAPGSHAGLLLVRLRDPGRGALTAVVHEIFATQQVTREVFQGFLPRQRGRRLRNPRLPEKNTPVPLRNTRLRERPTPLPLPQPRLPEWKHLVPLRNTLLPEKKRPVPLQNTRLPQENRPVLLRNTRLPERNTLLRLRNPRLRGRRRPSPGAGGRESGRGAPPPGKGLPILAWRFGYFDVAPSSRAPPV